MKHVLHVFQHFWHSGLIIILHIIKEMSNLILNISNKIVIDSQKHDKCDTHLWYIYVYTL